MFKSIFYVVLKMSYHIRHSVSNSNTLGRVQSPGAVRQARLQILCLPDTQAPESQKPVPGWANFCFAHLVRGIRRPATKVYSVSKKLRSACSGNICPVRLASDWLREERALLWMKKGKNGWRRRYLSRFGVNWPNIVQELCESRGGLPGHTPSIASRHLVEGRMS